MEILLDTHIALWAMNDDPKLTAETENILFNSNNKIYYSIISMWEVGIKHSVKPKEMGTSASEFMHYCEAAGFEKLSLDDRHVCAYETLNRDENAPEHKDPFDKMLLAQAKADGMLLITHDHKFAGWREPYVRIV